MDFQKQNKTNNKIKKLYKKQEFACCDPLYKEKSAVVVEAVVVVGCFRVQYKGVFSFSMFEVVLICAAFGEYR